MPSEEQEKPAGGQSPETPDSVAKSGTGGNTPADQFETLCAKMTGQTVVACCSLPRAEFWMADVLEVRIRCKCSAEFALTCDVKKAADLPELRCYACDVPFPLSSVKALARVIQSTNRDSAERN